MAAGRFSQDGKTPWWLIEPGKARFEVVGAGPQIEDESMNLSIISRREEMVTGASPLKLLPALDLERLRACVLPRNYCAPWTG
jgi:hypothetical protein